MREGFPPAPRKTGMVNQTGIRAAQAIQLGCMAVTRYFDSGPCCGVVLGPWYSDPDWIVTGLEYNPNDRAFPWRTTGVNLNRTEGEPDRAFSWRVPSLGTYRYDLSSALCPTCLAMRAAYAPWSTTRRPHMCAEHAPLIAKGKL